MRFARAIKKASDVIDGVVMKVVTVLVIAMIVTITLQIVSRTGFQAFTWTEELSRYFLVWSTFLGATLAYKRGMHISVTFVAEALSGTARLFLVISSYVLSLVFFGVAIWNGLTLIDMQIFQVSPALQLPMKWIYVGIPLGFSVMAIHALAKIFEELFMKEKEVKA